MVQPIFERCTLFFKKKSQDTVSFKHRLPVTFNDSPVVEKLCCSLELNLAIFRVFLG